MKYDLKYCPHCKRKINPLSPQERRILQLVSEGHSQKDIALIISIAEHTIKNHMTNILTKLVAENNCHAVRIAIFEGYIE